MTTQTGNFGELMRAIHKQAEPIFWGAANDPSFNIDAYFSSPGIINGYRASCLGHAANKGDHV